jgi:hypothetical protein
VGVDALDSLPDSGIGFVQGKESLVAQPAENAALRETDATFDLGFILRPLRSRRQNADTVNGGSKVDHGAAQNWASGGRFAPWRAR